MPPRRGPVPTSAVSRAIERRIFASLCAPLLAAAPAVGTNPTARPLTSGGYFVVGCDEAGRGPLAGPVVASALCLYVPAAAPEEGPLWATAPGGVCVTDSKQMDGPGRSAALRALVDQGLFAATVDNALRAGAMSYFEDGGVLPTDAGQSQQTTACLRSFGGGYWDDGCGGDRGVADALFVSDPKHATPAAGAVGSDAPVLVAAATCLVPPAVIDRDNILHASLGGMMRAAGAVLGELEAWWPPYAAAAALPPALPPVIMLVDGPHSPLEVLTASPAAAETTPAPPQPAASEEHDITNGDESGSSGGAGSKAKKAPKRGRVAAPPLSTLGRRLKENPHLRPDADVQAVLSRFDVCPPPGNVGWGRGAEHLTAARPPPTAAPTEPGTSHTHRPLLVPLGVVSGDAQCPAISAASILAKELRDAYMVRRLHPAYPHFGLDVHKGYPVPAHLAAIAQHGCCPQHRRSFGPVQKVLGLEPPARTASQTTKRKRGEAVETEEQ